MPLFNWWEHQLPNGKAAANPESAVSSDETRPLLAWQRITGVKVGDAGASWIVNAAIYASPTVHTNARILLNHPPSG